MKWIKKLIRCMQVFILAIVSLVSFDMLVLGGKIKLWIIAKANTTSASPFSTDGQSNWVLIFVGMGVVILLGWLSKHWGNNKDKEG